jgi:hypothetical protein
MLVGALGALGFAGFHGLTRLDVAAAMMQTRPGTAPGTTPGPAMVRADKAGAEKAPEKVKIWFFTVPVVPNTELRWGKKKLGIINPTKGPKKPFFIERPKDSGPMDVVARAEGFIPLNTRVFTYSDNKVWLKLTPEADKSKLLGYKVEIRDGGADGGVSDGGVAMPGPGVAQPLQPALGPAAPPGAPPPAGTPPVQAPAQ